MNKVLWILLSIFIIIFGVALLIFLKKKRDIFPLVDKIRMYGLAIALILAGIIKLIQQLLT